MPKHKSKKAVTKRIKVTASGKLLRSRQGKRHLLSCKNAKRRRKLRSEAQIGSLLFQKKIKELIRN